MNDQYSIEYYEEEIEKLKRKLEVRDRLLFKLYNYGVNYESRRSERETFQKDSEEN